MSAIGHVTDADRNVLNALDEVCKRNDIRLALTLCTFTSGPSELATYVAYNHDLTRVIHQERFIGSEGYQSVARRMLSVLLSGMTR